MKRTKLKSRRRDDQRRTEPQGGGEFTLGRDSFAKISAVEGIHLSPDMRQAFREFDRRGLTGAERRRAIARTYGKPSA